MKEYWIQVEEGIELPDDFEKHLMWAITDILSCSEQFVRLGKSLN